MTSLTTPKKQIPQGLPKTLEDCSNLHNNWKKSLVIGKEEREKWNKENGSSFLFPLS